MLDCRGLISVRSDVQLLDGPLHLQVVALLGDTALGGALLFLWKPGVG